MREFLIGLQHIGLPTEHLEETVQFYKILGFTNIYQTRNPAENTEVVFLSLGNFIVEVYETDNIKGESGAWEHIAFDVRKIECLYKKVAKLKISIISKGIEELPFWEKGIRYFIIQGINGERIEFCEKM